MQNIIDNLYVGSDDDFNDAVKKGFAIVSACKDGPNGHRHILGYSGLSAPKGKDYYFVERGKHMALNLIDSEDPNFIPLNVIQPGIDFVTKHIEKGNHVLVHCNAGHSRGPTTAMLYMRTVGEMPNSFVESEKIFHKLYSKYDPGQGMRQFARQNWNYFNLKG